jgi:hypothetical protein
VASELNFMKLCSVDYEVSFLILSSFLDVNFDVGLQ